MRDRPGNKMERRVVLCDDQLVYGFVDSRVARVRERSLCLMIERADEIEWGLRHLTPSMLKDVEEGR